MDGTVSRRFRDAPAPAAPTAAAVPAVLGVSLLESRQRWQDLALLGADMVFETDANGCFSFVFPDPALGCAAADLIGRPATDLLVSGSPNPFRHDRVARGLKAWLRRADGTSCCMAVHASPLLDRAGRACGLRGSARDITVQEAQLAAAAAALRRIAAFDHLFRRVRSATSSTERITIGLNAMIPALGCSGVAVLEQGRPSEQAVLHSAGHMTRTVLAEALGQSWPEGGGFVPDGAAGPLAVLPHGAEHGRSTVLAAWRPPGARGWSRDDRDFLGSVSELLRALLATELRELELERQARTDPLTGLLNRRAFLKDLRTRLEWPGSGEEARGSLLFIDLDNFKPLNDVLGHEAGDEALRGLAALLRDAVRPSDLVARLGGDEFAVWLEGANGRIAAGRADHLIEVMAQRFPASATTGPPPLRMSVGIATAHHPGQETPQALLQRADAAMYAAKHCGKGRWSLDEQQHPERGRIPCPPRT